jgi:hypothetical protein
MPLAQPLFLTPKKSLLEDDPTIEQLSKQLSATIPNDNWLKALGEKLWHALDCEATFEQATQSSGTKILPLLIDSNEAHIQQLPWESLYHPEFEFLANNPRFALCRHMPNSQPMPAIEHGPLKVLLLTALPDLPEGEFDRRGVRLNIEEEQAQVLEALLPLIREGKVILHMPDDGRYDTLCESIAENQPHLVFIRGHGVFDDNPLEDSQATAYFQFEDEVGQAEVQPATKIADAFFGAAVQCVVLSACESGKSSSDQLNNGLVQHLASVGIPHVIGMRESVYDIAGHVFAHSFCAETAEGTPVAYALQKARQALAHPKKQKDKTQLVEAIQSQLLLQQRQNQDPNGIIVLFFDNLESLQDPASYAITDDKLNQWINAARALTQNGLFLLLTSRWQLPDWPVSQHLQLGKLNYYDFLHLAQSQDLPLWLLQQPGKIKTLHKTLHGNGRGLTFFTAAVENMTQDESEAFEQTLASVTEQLKTDMALTTIIKHLDDDAVTLLCRMTAYASPVPLAGVIKVAEGVMIRL